MYDFFAKKVRHKRHVTEAVEVVVCEKKNIVAVGNLLSTSARPLWNRAQAKPGYPNGRFELQWRVGRVEHRRGHCRHLYTLAGLSSSTTYQVRVAYACGSVESVGCGTCFFSFAHK